MKAFQLKMVIKNSKPPIWRRIIVPAGITFSQLSMILNKAMGWSGYYLFEFEFYHLELRIAEDVENIGNLGYGPFDYLEAKDTFIREYLEENDWFTYSYDLGDDWQHRVTVEKIITDYEENYPQVIKYKGACPVEDSGEMQQGYSSEYDMACVNEELKNQFYYIWGKAEHRCQQDMIEEHWSGKYGLHATKRDKNRKASIVKSGKHKMEDAMQVLADRFNQMVRAEQSLHVSLKSIISNFYVEDIRDIAEAKGIKGINGCGKESLIRKLTEFMLQPEVMEQYFLCLPDNEIEMFEKAMNASQPYEVKSVEEFTLLYCTGYVGMLEDGGIVIPYDVAQEYTLLRGKEFTEKRKKRSYLFCCLKTVERLYGIAPVETVMKLLAVNEEIHMTEQELRSAIAEIPPEIADFVVSGDMVYHRQLYRDDRGLLKAQGDKAYYIPTREEIMDLGTKGYLPNNQELQKLVQYLNKKMKLSREDAEFTGMIIQDSICGDCQMQDIFDILEDSGVEPANEKQMHELIELINKLWNHTRMLLNRGFMPCELRQSRIPEISPMHGNNVIDFQNAKKTKIYPNDLCPCGSGKKYKHCCQKNKK